MTKGHNWEKRVKNAKRFGPLPEHLKRPALRMDCAFVYRAFWEDLHSCREYTAGGFGPIPHHRVIKYAMDLGLSRTEAQEMWTLIHEMDVALIEEQTKKVQHGA